MKKEYDFSKAERSKFYKKNARLKLPIYLDEKSQNFIEKIAQSKRKDLSTVVNDLIKTDISLAKVIS